MAPQLLVNALISVAGVIILAIVGKIVFGLHFPGNIFSFILAFVISIAGVFSIGFLISAVASSNRAAMAISFLIYFPMLFLSGATIPLDIMPGVIKTISKFIPLTYCVQILQGTWLGDPIGGFLKEILILLGITGVCAGLSVKLFRWE
jgi:ABC-2 type transport system permease protein